MSDSDPSEPSPLSHSHLGYAGVVARVVWRNLARLAHHPGMAAARPLRFPNRTPDIWAGWLGHATVLMHLFGSRVLADPFLGACLGGARRLVRLPMSPERLPALDAVLISHAHLDHLDRASLRRIPQRTRLIVPTGCADLVDDLGYEVTELGWEQELRVGELTIRAFRPRHWGRRSPLGEERGYNSYLLTRRGWSILVGGDSAYTESFRSHCRGSHVALAVLPIGCYRPELFHLAHLSPEEALQVFREVGADYMLPVHWGTFLISLEPPAEPARRLMAEATRLRLLHRVNLVWPGGDFTYPGS